MSASRDLRLAMVGQAKAPVRAKDAMAEKVNKICPASFDPRVMNKIILTDLCEIPDKWKEYPRSVQQVYLASYNANIERWNNVTWAMKTADKSAKNKWNQLRAEESRKNQRDNTDHDRYTVRPGGRVLVSFAGAGV